MYRFLSFWNTEKVRLDDIPHILQRKYHGGWNSGDRRYQGISSNDSDVVLPDNSWSMLLAFICCLLSYSFFVRKCMNYTGYVVVRLLVWSCKCWVLLILLNFCLRTDQSTLVNHFCKYYLLYRFTCITILFRQHRSVHMYISHAILKRLPDHLTSEIHLFKEFSLCSRHDIYWWRKNSANRLSYIQYGLKTFKLVIDFHDVDVQI